MPREASYGFHRAFIESPNVIPTGTGAATLRAAFTPGFRFIIEKVRWVTTVAGTGAGASRTFRVLKNASVVAATRTLVLADTAAVGQTVDYTVTAADATFDDDDTLTLDVAAGGTAFTAGQGYVEIQYRALAQRKA